MTRRSSPVTPSNPDQFSVYVDEMDNELKMLDYMGNIQRIRPLGNLGDQFADAADITGGSGRFTGGLGYNQGAGAGGVVAQVGSKANAVTLNALTGNITMDAAALAGGAVASFTFNNSEIGADDMLRAEHHSGGTFGAYVVSGRATSDGVGSISVRNVTGGSLSQAIVIKFMILRGAVT